MVMSKRKTKNDSDLKGEFLICLRTGDRVRAEFIRVQRIELAAKDFAREIEVINSSFYRAFSEWDNLKELKEWREDNAKS